MTFSKAIFLGLGVGIATGLFLGESAGFLDVVAESYIQLLQMTVLPYVMLSLITGLGSLTYRDAKMIFFKVGGVLLVLWAMALVMVFLMPIAFPAWKSASFFSTALLRKPESVDFLQLYIPSNPFYSMANNVVPAVVLFSAIVGVALIGVQNKERFIDVLNVFNSAITRATGFVVKLTPIGIFAIAAHAAGTMTLEELGRLQVYLVVYVAIALLITFWALPALVAGFTPIRYREVVGVTKDALLTAFMTGNLFIVLPILTDASKKLLMKHNITSGDEHTLPDVIVPASFNFPHTGKLLSLSFILFAAWFSGSDLALGAYPKLATMGLVSLFGSLTVGVPFLLDAFRIPADMFELFLATSVVNARVGTMIAAMHTVVVAILGTCAILGALRINGRGVLRYAVILAAATVVVIGGTRIVFTRTVENEYRKDKVLEGMHLLRNPLPATVYLDPEEVPPLEHGGRPVLESIHERGILRVGYHNRALPYAYINASGDLVGFDVEMAHRLAKELGVGLEFVPLEYDLIPEQLKSGYCDVVMSGFAVTTERAQSMTFSEPYLTETLGLIVSDHRRHEFYDIEGIRRMPRVRIGVPDVPYYVEMVRTHLTNAEIVALDDALDFFEGKHPDVDALVFTAERGSVWTLLYPEFAVVVPQPGTVGVPLAYAAAGGDAVMTVFLNTWIELKKNDGTIGELFDYWIMGKNAAPVGPRWSIMRNVLQWVD
jgi:Na+/H+-dicarboxylate symporter